MITSPRQHSGKNHTAARANYYDRSRCDDSYEWQYGYHHYHEQKKLCGLLKAVRRKLAGESLFINHFEPKNAAGEVFLGTSLAGDMMTLDLDNESLIVQNGSFMASSEGIGGDMGWPGG